MDGILGQSSSPHKKIQYLKITVILKYPLKCINSIKHLDEGTQFYCVNTSYPMDNSLSGGRRPARQTSEKDVLYRHQPAGP